MLIDRDRVAAELPPAARAWLARSAGPATWRSIALDVAVAAGRRLLAGDPPGEAGWDRPVHDLRLADPSPAVRVVAAALGCSGRAWSADAVTRAMVAYLCLGGPGARRTVADRLRDSFRSVPGGRARP